MSDRYRINEIFWSPQGEGLRAGQMSMFVRFTGCNMRCTVEPGPKSPGGFDCDTEFESGRWMTIDEISKDIAATLAAANSPAPTKQSPIWIVCTGGEPALQLDADFCAFFHDQGFRIAVETNGSIELPRLAKSLDWDMATLAAEAMWTALEGYAVDWITVSPKVAEHAIRQPVAHELKYVRGYGQALPKPACMAPNKLISPAFNGLAIDAKAMGWCLDLTKEDPSWRLSVQMHKAWKVR